MKTFFPLLMNLAGKDFKLKYRRSFLGVLWSILNPLFTMLVITQVFGILLKVKVENFATYYIVGWSLWNFFSESTSMSMSSVIYGAPLIKKVYLPKYIFPLEKCLFALINLMLSLIAVLAVMLIQGVFPSWSALLFPIPVIYCFIFCVGFSLILSALTVFFRDIMHLYSVLLTVWMYLTPLIYPFSLVENTPFISDIVRYNPMTLFIEYFRSVVMYGTVPSLETNLLCLVISLLTFALGALIFSKAQKRFILHI
ncbi:MAG: ABC transporter permease [Clostridia bacterium]|nr:ABC transporter permease [Clostridia bacterium]